MPHCLIVNGVVHQLDLTGAPPNGYIECPDYVQPGYIFNGSDFIAPEIEEIQSERQPGIVAQVRLKIYDNIVQSVSTDGGLSNCVAFEPGVMWCEFPSPVEGEYLVWPSNGATHRCYSLADEQFPEGFAVRSETYGGDVEFPECMQILVTKI